MSSASIEPSRPDWPCTIGNFLINFGTLEWLVNVYLKDHLDSDEYSRVKEWHLKDRLSRIAQYLKDVDCLAKTREEFESVLVQLDPIRNLRNHIAHGHMTIMVNLETQIPEILISRPKDLDQEYSPEARHVTFGEMRQSLADLTKLIERFKAIVGFKDLP